MSFNLNMYIDIDSSYRNREDYPNPADFVILSKQDNLVGLNSFKNPCSNQVILYPPFGTEPLYFYSDPSGEIIENQYLPYMYKTNDPHIIQLDELSIAPTDPTDIGQIIINDLYPRGSIPLGQANQFYTNDYLENFITKETRQIISFTYETATDIVFQSSQVLWSTVVGDVFKIGVAPISSTTIPPSNIYNYYRGKYLKMITGSASGFKSLIVDYTIVNESLSVFTLNSFSGVLPRQGDTFQIVSDRRWYATVESPFSTPLPAYPAYQQALPVTDIQFSSNTVYSSSKKIKGLAVSEAGDLLFGESTNTTITGLDIYNLVLYQTADNTNYFWKTPITLIQTVLNSGVNYLNNEAYSIQFTDSTYTNWTIASSRVEDDIITYDGNILKTPNTLASTFTNYVGQLRKLRTSNYDGVVFVYKDTVLKIRVDLNSILADYPMDESYEYSAPNSTTTILIHAFEDRNNLPYICWSEYDSSANTLKYYFSIATDSDGQDLFITITEIIGYTSVPTTFQHTIRTLHILDYNNTYYFPLLAVDDTQFKYRIYTSTNDTSWTLYDGDLFILGTIVPINSGVFLYEYQSKLYAFIWSNSGLVYCSSEFSPASFSSYITINSSNSIDECVVSENVNGLFIAYTYQGTDGVYRVITLNTQQFEISTAVPYRIRKGPTKYSFDTLLTNYEDIILSTNTNFTGPSSTGYKDILYGFDNRWHYVVNNTVYHSQTSSPSDWTATTLPSIPTSLNFVKMLQTSTQLTLVYSGIADTKIYTSSDGITWNLLSLSTPPSGINLRTFNLYDSTNYIASTGTNLYTSMNLTNWTSISPSPTIFKQILWIPELSSLVAIPETGNTIYRTGNPPTTWTLHSIPLLSPTISLADLAWSPTLNMLIVTTVKTDPNASDFVYTFNFTDWFVSYQYYAYHTNHRIVWNSYFSGFIALSYFTYLDPIVSPSGVLLFSMDGKTWSTCKTNRAIDFDLNQEMMGTVSQNIDSGIYFFVFQPYLNTNRIALDDKELVQSFLWVYNRPYPYNQSYQLYNTIYQIIDYDSVTKELILNQYLTIQLPFRTYFEILSDIEDCFNGINYPLNYNHEKCYSIAIQDIILPNKVLSTYLGNQISFYPYIYIKITNEGANASSLYSFMTNNPNATTVTFKIPVSQFTNDPSALPFIRLSSGMTVKAKFNLRSAFRFTVYLPNGDVFKTVEEDNITPDFPNPLLQISATIRITDP